MREFGYIWDSAGATMKTWQGSEENVVVGQSQGRTGVNIKTWQWT